jgi:hypothetical protein
VQVGSAACSDAGKRRQIQGPEWTDFLTETATTSVANPPQLLDNPQQPLYALS